MWRIWLFFGIFEISFGAPVDTPQEDVLPAAELSTLKCLLLASPLNTCDDWRRSKDTIPHRIQKLYQKCKKPFTDHGAAKEILDPSTMDSIPHSLLYLIPKVRLNAMSGSTAANILRKFPFDDALALKITGLLTDNAKREQFLYGLAGLDAPRTLEEADEDYGEEVAEVEAAGLSPSVEEELGQALARWFPNSSLWDLAQFEGAMKAGTPLLASLPSHFLQNIPVKSVEKFLYHLRSWRWDADMPLSEDAPSSSLLWSHHPRHVQRMWAQLTFTKGEPPARWSPRLLRQLSFLLVGATPDELAALPPELKHTAEAKLLLDKPWSPLQARAVFDVLFSARELTAVTEVKDLARVLLPRQLQQLTINASDFTFLSKSSVAMSLSTEKQIFASQLAHSVSASHVAGLDVASWKNDTGCLGRALHTVPASVLRPLSNESLSASALAKIDSTALSYRQARYLARGLQGIDLQDPRTFLSVKGLLKSVSSTALTQTKSSLMPQSSKQHLLSFLPASNLAFAAVTLDRLRDGIADVSLLESVLRNPDHHKVLGLLSSRDVASKFRDMSASLQSIVETSPELEKSVRSLPATLLAQLLALHRHDAGGRWTWDNLMESTSVPALKYYVAGLTCADVAAVDTADIVPILGYYVREKRALAQPFPKNMQYCSQKAVTEYLQLKASLRNIDVASNGLVNLLESHEARALGGYVLASLPLQLLTASHLAGQVVAEVGRLSVMELLVALEHSALRFLAQTQSQLDLRGLNRLGNLVWFLEPSHVGRIHPADLRLFVESLDDGGHRALCLAGEQRGAWRRALIAAFGKPDSWSAGVVEALGDLMFVLDEYELSRVNKTSWTTAADTLTKASSFYTSMEWPGRTRPVAFYQVCLEVLPEPEGAAFMSSVKTLVRFYLEAAQQVLNTVVPASDLLRVNEQLNLVEKVPSAKDVLKSTEATTVATTEATTEATTAPSEAETTTVHMGDIAMGDQPAESGEDDSMDWLYDYDEGVTVSSDIDMEVEGRWKREIAARKEGKQEARKTKDVEIFRSRDDKTPEQRREELRRNATRDLVVEVVAEGGPAEVPDTGKRSARPIKVSCDAVRMLGVGAALVLDETDLARLTDEELEDCAEVLGALDLPLDLRRTVFSRLNLWKESGNLLEVGGLVAAIAEQDLGNLSLALEAPWTLDNLAVLSSHVTDPDIASLITDQFLLDNADLREMSPAAAASLGRLVCTLPRSHRRSLLLSSRDTPILHVAPVIARGVPCDGAAGDGDPYRQCLEELAALAEDEDGWGPTAQWDASDVASLDTIVAGLSREGWHGADGKGGLRPEALAGLSPAAVACIPPKTFKDLSEEQLSWLPALSVAAISPAQSSSLSPSQFEVLDRVRRQVPDLSLRGASSAASLVPSLSTLGATAATLLLTLTTFLMT